MAASRTTAQRAADFKTYVVVPPADLSSALREELLSFRTLQGWLSAAVTRRDGLTIQHTLATGAEAASLSAMAAALVGSARSTGNELEQGPFQYGIVQYNEGVLVVTEAGPEAILACLLASHVNLGLALLKIHRVSKSIGARLEAV